MSQETLDFLLVGRKATYDLLEGALSDCSDLSFTLTSEVNVKKAIPKVLKHQHDLYFIDYSVGDKEGIKFIHEIKKQNPDIPMVVLLEKAHKGIIRSAINKGAADFLVKCELESKAIMHTIFYARQFSQHNKITQELSKRYDILLNSITEGIIELDLNGNITFINDVGSTLLANSTACLIGMPIKAFAQSANIEGCQKFSEHPIFVESAKGQHYRCEEDAFITKQGNSFPVEYTSAPILYDGTLESIVIVFQNIEDKLRSEQQLQFLAKHDSLTGLPNRNEFNELLPVLTNKAGRENNQLALMFLDLDSFKNVNDTLGHHVGDELLKVVGNRLKGCLRKSDYVFRLGGDEFTVILSGKMSADRTAVVSERIIKSLTQPIAIGQNQLNIGTSIGIALYPSCANNAEDLVKHADMAMYSAKKHGGCSYVYYTDAFNQEVKHRMTLENNLRKALENNEICLKYEPRIDLVTQDMVGAEAAIAWENKELGSVSPAEFIPIAEECGVITQIGKWAIETCCKDMNRWMGTKIGPVPVSINTSLRQLSEPSFVEHLLNCVSKYNIPEGYLTIELLESTVIANPEALFNVLKSLHKKGIRILIDHFGAGQSYLSYLKYFPVDYVKIDRSFIKDINIDENNTVILQGLIQLAHGLNVKVVAEDIEREEQYQFMKKAGCDFAEGSYFGQLLTVTQFAKFMNVHQKNLQKGIVSSRWHCLCCDYIYHEEQGVPDIGIAPGTTWDKLPTSWECPTCHADKERFEVIKLC